MINDEEIQKRVSNKRRSFTYEEEFNKFFKGYEKVLLNEVIETRFNKQKNMWEFIYKNK